MWDAATRTGFDPTAALAQQLSDLAIYEQPLPPATAAEVPKLELFTAEPRTEARLTSLQLGQSGSGHTSRGPIDVLGSNSPYTPGTWIPQHDCEDHGATMGAGGSFAGPAKPLLLACPYLKYDSSREHLHRTHRQKPNCPRCRSIFETETEVGQHLKGQTLCKVVQGEGLVEGFDAVQEKLLKSKKRRKGVETEEDKWREIFRILFPDHKYMPDPFFKTSVDDQHATAQPSKNEQDDVESIFTGDIPSPVEDETFSEMEEAVGGRLSKKKRRKLMNVFKGFAVKMLRQSAEGDVTKRGIKLASNPSEAEKAAETVHAAAALSEKRQLEKADEKPNEKPIEKLDGANVMPEATQTIEPFVAPVTSLSSPPAEAAEQRAVHFDLQSFDIGNDSDIACWPAWDAAFANGSGDSWLEHVLGNGTPLQGPVVEELDKALGVAPLSIDGDLVLFQDTPSA
ncbi:hypothetical protein CORC01_13515 [Colletotrichum orchidophilum]|uniref:C2H2-type domain-containing protein n=1 Tax=Colletotrichum orchidophilum TaxID=1209926 RepID=A0A1G4AQ17_9PEZI|nr:uncharacterized protein CORC01_13515 [Colletotrichum orchidophilum]OHE91173.1 hypothetical protein CORC01_13515 [Colletotrichum orchidophilum]